MERCLLGERVSIWKNQLFESQSISSRAVKYGKVEMRESSACCFVSIIYTFARRLQNSVIDLRLDT